MSYEINYPKMIDDALHNVVKDILKLVSKSGLKDGHHFFISFITDAPGVELSEHVKSKYPTEITIVIQYQFKDLDIGEDYFSIRLSFDGVEEKVVVPFKSITAFSDPMDKISLQFHYYQEEGDIDEEPVQKEIKEEIFASQDIVESSNVIQLDKFRQTGDK